MATPMLPCRASNIGVYIISSTVSVSRSEMEVFPRRAVGIVKSTFSTKRDMRHALMWERSNRHSLRSLLTSPTLIDVRSRPA